MRNIDWGLTKGLIWWQGVVCRRVLLEKDARVIVYGTFEYLWLFRNAAGLERVERVVVVGLVLLQCIVLPSSVADGDGGTSGAIAGEGRRAISRGARALSGKCIRHKRAALLPSTALGR